MVGVPKSKGCLNCRKRKKGCDQKRPTCGRCVKLGLECGGYRERLKFVDENPGTNNKSLLVQTERNISPRTDSVPQRQRSLSLTPTRALYRLASQEQAKGSFWNAYVPQHSGQAANLALKLNLLTSLRWVQAAIEYAHTDPILDSALLALTVARAGQMENDVEMKRRAAVQYYSTMDLVRMALDDQSKWNQDTLLAAVMVLGLYEIQIGSERRGPAWVAHVTGATKLIALRGPSNLCSDLGRRLYEGHLLNEIINAIGTRNKIPFRRPNVPLDGTSSPTSSDPKSQLYTETELENIRLFTVMSAIAPIMALADRIQLLTSIDVIIKETISLHNQVNSTIVELKKWYSNLESRHPDQTLYWPEPSTLYLELPEDSPQRIFTTYNHFLDLGVAFQVNMYWSSLILLFNSLNATYDWLKQIHPEINLPYNLTNDTTITKTDPRLRLSLSISQSLEYFIHPRTGLAGAQLIGFPTNIAMCYLVRTHHVAEAAWFEVIFAKLRSRGLQIEGFLREIALRQGRNGRQPIVY